jgi:glycerate kinase
MASGVQAGGGVAIARPLADGGEGTVAVLREALGGQMVSVEATGPLGDPVMADYLWVPGTGTAIIETASAAGLTLVPPDRRRPERASTFGVGELIAAAVAKGARRILLGVGGSASTDGGLGAIEALTGAGGLHGAQLTVLCDVTTPFEDAARVFGPQKGADAATVIRLSERLRAQAARYPRDPTGVARTGCAGGLSGGLWSVFDAQLVSGIEAVLDLLGFAAEVVGAAAVVTGEGQLDAQSAQGKVLDGLGALCRAHAVPLHAIVGRSIADRATLDALGLRSVTEAPTLELIQEGARRITAELHAQPAPELSS